MKSDVARLCLGTAQFGSHYGATNLTGKPSHKEIQAIIDCAHAAGIRYADMARGYGWHGGVPLDWNVITKLKAADINVADQLVRAHPWAILSHELEAEHLVRAIKAAGYTGRIGQSVYARGELSRWAQVIQFPLNIADRRFEGLLPRTCPHFARSIFLQGKLLEMGYSVSDCLGYVLRQPVDCAIVGVNSVRELEEIIRAAEALPETIPEIPQPVLTAAELDPRTWKS